MRVELLYTDGCPHSDGVLLRLRELVGRAGVDAEVKLRGVGSEQRARALRFLGSPTVRVDGRDVEPGADERDDFGLGCRLYRTPKGLAGSPPDEWMAAAIAIAIALERPVGGPLAERLRDLPERCRELHRTALRAFLDGHRPARDDLRRSARELDLDPDAALEDLERRDALWIDRESGAVSAAYPFSGVPTRHEVAFPRTGTHAFAMCAIDALGVAFMAGERVVVRSRDPIGGEPIEASIDPAGTYSWEPAGAVVIAATPADDGPNAATCCPNVNFLASRQRAEETVDGPGAVLEMPEAIELGRRIFGSLLYDA